MRSVKAYMYNRVSEMGIIIEVFFRSMINVVLSQLRLPGLLAMPELSAITGLLQTRPRTSS